VQIRSITRALIVAGVGLSAPVLAQVAEPPTGKRAVTHEDIWLAPRVAAPVVSPDGKNAVFSVTDPAYDAEHQASDVWLVATDGKMPPRRLTQTRAPEAGLTWSPDSRRIAFSTKREGDEANQIYVLDVAGGGEAQRATTISTGARLPKFSPDGARLAFTSDVPAESRNDEDSKRIIAEEKARKYRMRAYDAFPIRNWDTWLPENRRPHAFVQTLGRNDPRDLFAGTELVEQPGFNGRSTQSANELDLIWAPDGQSLIFAATRNAHRGAHDFTNTELWQVALDGGEPRRLTGGLAPGGKPGDDLTGGDSWSEPRFSPDGRSLYALKDVRGKHVFAPTHLAAFDWPSMQARPSITLPAERDPLNFVIAPNSRDIYMVGEDAGNAKIYRGKSSGGEAQLAFEMSAGVYSNLSSADAADRLVLIANFDSAVSPHEVVRIDPSRGHRGLTHFTTGKMAALDMAPVEHFWFDSKRGARIHNMIVRPPGFDPAKKYPLLVLMHGGPHAMWRDTFFLRWNYHLIASPGYVVLLTNYTGSTGFGAAFSQGIQGDPLLGPALEINQAADEALARYAFIDGTRQCAGGASYGGHLANWLQASTDRYRCLISHAGLINLESQWATSDITFPRERNMGGPPWQQGVDWSTQNPIRYAPKWRTPVLLTIGERDFRVPLNNTLEYWSVLQRQQVQSRLLVFPDENHWILNGENNRQFFVEVHQWLARWLN